jgi:hypothetical protein
MSAARKLMVNIFWDRKGVLMVEFRSVLQNTEKLCGAIQKNRVEYLHPVECSSMTICVHIHMLALQHCWSISTGNCLTTLLRALILLRATNTCLPTRGTGWDYRTWKIMSWWKVSKVAELTSGWVLWQAYKNLFWDNKSLSSSGDYIEKYLKYVFV